MAIQLHGNMKKNINEIQNMKRISIITTLLVALGVSVAPAQTYAANYVGVEVRIEAPGETIDSRTVYIPDTGCTVKDSSGVEHTIEGAKAICALQQAAAEGEYSYAVQNSDWGLYLNGIGKHTATASQYWLYYVDFASASAGIADQEMKDGQQLLFVFGDGSQPPLDISAHTYHRAVGRPVRIHVNQYETDYTTGQTRHASAVGMTVYIDDTTVTTDAFGNALYVPETPGMHTVYVMGSDGNKSQQIQIYVYERKDHLHQLGKRHRKQLIAHQVEFLQKQYAADALGDDATKQWAAMALAVAGEEPKKLMKEMKEYTPTTASDYARTILTLEAMGYDTRSFQGTDYVEGLKNTMVNNQFGDESSCVDDIFAGYALLAANEPLDSSALRSAVAYSLKCVNEQGYVSYNIDGPEDMDTTAAWLGLAARLQGKQKQATLGIDISEQRKAAVNYVRHAQKPDGGWGYNAAAPSNSSTTAWILMALRARGHEARAMTTNNQNGFNYLREVTEKGAVHYNQHESQSVEALNTAYSILALSKKSFPVNKKVSTK